MKKKKFIKPLKQRLPNLFKKNYLNSLYIFFLGVLSSYSLPPYNYFIINFITFSLFFIFIFNKKKKLSINKSFFKYGWYFGFGYFLFSLYWIVISLTFDQSFKFLIPVAIILLPAGLAIFYGLLTYLFSIFYSKNIIVSFLIFSLLFGIIELIRSFIFTGFPWNLISFSFSENTRFIQILSILGTYSFNLICISLFTCPSLIILSNSRKKFFLIFSFILIVISFFIFGTLKKDQFNNLTNKKHDYVIRVVSPNIGLDRFYSGREEIEIINELILLSNPQPNIPTVFVWPEGIITDTNLRDIKIYENLFSKKFTKNHIIIMGINNLEIKDDKELHFNSLAIFDNDLNLLNHYNKVDLVPFGEFLPFENFLSAFGLKTITNEYKSFTKGKDRRLVNLKHNKIDFVFLPLICYELIYSGRLIDNHNFDYIINISEDGWFGDSIGPKQHFAHGIFRSIESGKYIIRSANNGISAIINPIGELDKKIKFGNSGYIDFTQSKSTKATLFSKYGNKIFILLILLYIFLIFSFNRIKNE